MERRDRVVLAVEVLVGKMVLLELPTQAAAAVVVILELELATEPTAAPVL